MFFRRLRQPRLSDIQWLILAYTLCPYLFFWSYLWFHLVTLVFPLYNCSSIELRSLSKCSHYFSDRSFSSITLSKYRSRESMSVRLYYSSWSSPDYSFLINSAASDNFAVSYSSTSGGLSATYFVSFSYSDRLDGFSGETYCFSCSDNFFYNYFYSYFFMASLFFLAPFFFIISLRSLLTDF